MQDDKQWHLDRRVPIALILAIAMQTGAAIWWAAGINARVDQLEKQIAAFVARTEGTERAVSSNSRDIAVLAAGLKSTNEQLERLYQQGLETNSLLRQIINNSGGR